MKISNKALLTTVVALMLLTVVGVIGLFPATIASGEGNTLTVTNSDSDGPGSLREILANAEDGDTIVFGSGVTHIELLFDYFASTDEIRFSQKNITIDGGAGVTISKAPSTGFRVLNSTAASGTLTLKGLTIENGIAASGGGVYAASNIVLIDCVFTDNNGGGVYSMGDVNMTSCIFTDNMAGSYGGGAYADGSISLTDCAFTGNSASIYSGGGAYAKGNALLNNCVFADNTAQKDGGAVYTEGNAIMNNCILTGNVADIYGSAVYADGDIILNDCGISQNTSAYGTVFSFNGEANARNCSFFLNELTDSGTGTIDVWMNVTLYHCTFTNNIGNAYNVFVFDAGGTVNAENCLMTWDQLAGNCSIAITSTYSNKIGAVSDTHTDWFGDSILELNYVLPLSGMADGAVVISGYEADAAGSLRGSAGSPCLYGAVNHAVSGSGSSCTIWFDGEPGGIVAFSGSNVVASGSPVSGKILFRSVSPYYDVFGWTYAYGGNEIYEIGSILIIDIDEIGVDVTITPNMVYYSESNVTTAIIDAKTSLSASDFTKMWEYCNPQTKATSSGTVWTITSTPLIVGNYAYAHVGTSLHKIDTATGTVVAEVEVTKSKTSFYQYLGYGNGFIIYYETGEVFDLDLNWVGYIDKNNSIGSSFYYEGEIYGLFDVNGKLLLKKFTMGYKNGTFTVTFDQTSSWKDGINTSNVFKEGNLDRYATWHWQNTASPPVFHDGYIYYLSVLSPLGVYNKPYKTFLNSINIETGAKKTIDMELDYRYLDDGWLTAYGDYLYVTSYTRGMFEEDSGGTSYSAITAVKLDSSGGMAVDFNVTLDGYKGWTSQFVVYNDRGYINVEKAINGTLMVFDINTLGTGSQPIYTVETVKTHGGIVLNTHYANIGNNYEVQIYILPYDCGNKDKLVMVSDRADQTSGTATALNIAMDNYTSQAVRADADGRFIWYADTGGITAAGKHEDNTYYVLLTNGTVGTWISVSGATASEAINKINGITVVSNNITALNYSYDGGSISASNAVNVRTYYLKDGAWTATGARTVNQPLYHYWIIATASSVERPSEGSAWAYDSSKVYNFSNTVGDLGIFGKVLRKNTTLYEIECAESENGGFIASFTRAAESAIVKITATPDKGYALDSISISQRGGSGKIDAELSLSDGKYQFVMPGYDVIIETTFKKSEQHTISIQNSGSGSTIVKSASGEAIDKAHGNDVIFIVAEPSTDYKVGNLFVIMSNGKTVSYQKSDEHYVFIMPDENVTVEIEYMYQTYTITYILVDHGYQTSTQISATRDVEATVYTGYRINIISSSSFTPTKIPDWFVLWPAPMGIPPAPGTYHIKFNLGNPAVTYTVTLNVKPGGKIIESDMSVGKMTLLDLSDASGTDYVPSSMTFKGWSTLPNGEGTVYELGENFEIDLRSNTYLYAIWEPDGDCHKIDVDAEFGVKSVYRIDTASDGSTVPIEYAKAGETVHVEVESIYYALGSNKGYKIISVQATAAGGSLIEIPDLSIITANSTLGIGHKASFSFVMPDSDVKIKVEFENTFVPLSFITFDSDHLEGEIGEIIWLNWYYNADASKAWSPRDYTFDIEGIVSISYPQFVTTTNDGVQGVCIGLRGESPGTVTVTFSMDEIVAKCAVTVLYGSLDSSSKTVSVELNKTADISITLPNGYSPSTVVWEVENSYIANYSGSGAKVTITGRNIGTTTVTATVAGLYRATFTVTVTQPPVTNNTYTFFIQMKEDYDKVSSSYGYTESQLRSGFTISATGSDAGDALKKACEARGIPISLWTGSAGGEDLKGWIGSIFGLGDVSREGGIWTYWAQYKDGKFNDFTLGYYTSGGSFSIIRLTSTPDGDVVPYVRGVSLGNTSLTLNVGDSATLSYSLNPSDAYYKGVTWSSSDSTVATVDSSGSITALKAGTAKITIKTADGGYTATCTITVPGAGEPPAPPVTVPVTGVSLDKTAVTLTAGGTGALKATVSPSDATNKNVTWSSSNTSVATVNGSGLITAVGAGAATIAVTSSDGGFTASCTVTVKASSNIGIVPETETIGGETTATVTDDQIGNAVNQAKSADGNTVPVLNVNVPSNSSSKKVIVKIPASGLSAFADEGGEAKISTPAGTVTLDNDALKEMSKSGSGQVEIIIEQIENSSLNGKQKDTVGNNPVYSITAMVGGVPVSELGGLATVTIPYELGPGLNPSLLVVWCVDDLGNTTEYPCSYDAASKTVTFVTDHFSHYVVVYTGTEDNEASGGGDMWLYIGIAAVLLIVVCAGLFFYVRSKKSPA